jgi:hypothetical protein
VRRRLHSVAIRSLLMAAGWAAIWVGTSRRLPGPPIRHPGRIGTWWQSEGPIVAVFSMARIGLLAAGGYWLGLLTLVAVGLAGRPGMRAIRYLSHCRLPGARRAAGWTAGLSAAGSVVLAAGTAGAASAASAATTPVVQAPGLVNASPPSTDGKSAPGSGAALVPAPPGRDQPPVLRYIGPAGAERATKSAPGTTAPRSTNPPATAPSSTAPPATSATTTAPPATSSANTTPAPASAPAAPAPTAPPPAPTAPAPAPTAPAPTAPIPAAPARATPARPPAATNRPAPNRRSAGAHPAAAQWTVRPGDDFWSISESTLRAAWGRVPTAQEIAPYWLTVIAANRDRLPDPGNPNLLFPGNVLVLPDPTHLRQ